MGKPILERVQRNRLSSNSALMLILLTVFPCTTFKHTITVIALTTLQSYILIKYNKRTIVNQTNKLSFPLQINTIIGFLPNLLAEGKILDILKYWHCHCGSFFFLAKVGKSMFTTTLEQTVCCSKHARGPVCLRRVPRNGDCLPVWAGCLTLPALSLTDVFTLQVSFCLQQVLDQPLCSDNSSPQ